MVGFQFPLTGISVEPMQTINSHRVNSYITYMYVSLKIESIVLLSNRTVISCFVLLIQLLLKPLLVILVSKL